MKLFKLLLVLMLAGIIACQQKTEQKAEETTGQKDSVQLKALLSNYHDERLQFYPLEATFAGDNRYNDTLPNNISQQYLNKLEAFYSKYKNQLQELDRGQLSENEQMSYDILMWECDINLESFKYPTHLTPIDQFWSLHISMGQLASGAGAQPFKTVEDYNNWLKRLDDFTIWCDTAIANMKEGVKTGWVLPKSLTAKVIPQMADLDHGPVNEHLFYSPINLLPEEFSDEDKKQLTEKYQIVLEDKVIPTFKRLHDFLKNEYLPACRETAGAHALPNGEEYYAFRIKQYTTTTKSADEIFELGKSEVARLLSEMEKVKEQVGFEGDIMAFFEHVRARKELMPFTSPDQVITHFNEIHERMKPQLKELFDLVPKTPFEVRRTEAFREASASAEYNPGSLDGTRPGIFYVPIPDVSKYNLFSDESLFLHEAIPGHHYQISLQQENENLPEFRRTLWYSAYGEGWALYSESLGKELGLYTDPYQYFGMLSAEMHRAIRLVVDAGMHAKGWTREQAIQYSLENEAESKESITSEIERYMAMPGQALSYKMGQLKIIELRNKAEQALGDKFDIKEFHNKVLESGCVPLAVLEKKIDRWIAE
ncbi:DUF885 domain-containing protein [Fulvivirga kasyanovii]|uniref:DUF885 domain-containing protein n=1 Tax=Fulvivirga kasyanovii TaxID=396812 RepID=A0ABW9RPD5_9BACT|nr:DUF885 domain-containing protein [Fulvivirga kasyanovii]MTI26004.1 DUF885 domain-containing protein [Fulvivirga kasyanovii]